MKNFITILTATALTFVAATAFSTARDSDGSRIKARAIKLGVQVKDKLTPPSDKTDWYYFQIKKAAHISIKVASDSTPPRFTLSNTAGKSISLRCNKVTSKKIASSVSIEKLNPGIYYLAVSADAATSYSLSIK